MGRDKKTNRLALGVATATLAATFACGVYVGHFRVFPFKELRVAKNALVGSPAGATRQSPLQNRRMNSQERGRRLNFLNRIDIHEGYSTRADVVMVGDSLTDYAEWSEMFPDVAIVNRGIAGDTTEGLLERLDSVIATGADIALIMIGVNDIGPGVSAEQIYLNYEKIVLRLLENGIQPCIQSTLLVGRTQHGKNPVIAALNKRLVALAEREKLTYIDLNARIAPSGELETQYASGDSVHLNAKGYAVWREMIAPIVTNPRITSHSNIHSAVADLETNR